MTDRERKTFIKKKRANISPYLTNLKRLHLIYEDKNDQRSTNYKEIPLKITQLGYKVLEYPDIDIAVNGFPIKIIDNQEMKLRLDHKKEIDQLIKQIISYIDKTTLIQPMITFPTIRKDLVPSPPEFRKHHLYTDLGKHVQTFLDMDTFNKDLEEVQRLSDEAQEKWKELQKSISETLDKIIGRPLCSKGCTIDCYNNDLVSWVVLGMDYKLVHKDLKYFEAEFGKYKCEPERKKKGDDWIRTFGFGGIPLITMSEDTFKVMGSDLLIEIIQGFMSNIEDQLFYSQYVDLLDILNRRNELLEHYKAPFEQEILLKVLKGNCVYIKNN